MIKKIMVDCAQSLSIEFKSLLGKQNDDLCYQDIRFVNNSVFLIVVTLELSFSSSDILLHPCIFMPSLPRTAMLLLPGLLMSARVSVTS